MEITELVWKLFLLLVPGVVASLMLDQIANRNKQPVFRFIVESALFGIAAFLIMEFFYSLYNLSLACFSPDKKFEFGLNLLIWDSLFNDALVVNKVELLISYLLSIPLGVVFGIIYSKRLVNKVFKRLNITNRYGDDDVWSHFLNLPSTDYIIVRDRQTSLSYYGLLHSFSDSKEKREILLYNVDVYSTDAWTFQHSSEYVFLELDKSNYSIEIPKVEKNERKQRKHK